MMHANHGDQRYSLSLEMCFLFSHGGIFEVAYILQPNPTLHVLVWETSLDSITKLSARDGGEGAALKGYVELM